MQAALRPAYAGKVRRRKAAHWAAFLPIKRAACPMFGTNRPACVAGGAKRCPRGGFPRADSASPVCSVKNVCRKLRAGPARVPQDAAFSEKQNADRPRRGVMRPQPPHRAGFLCRLPVFRVLTAWQAKGRPKSVRFCADYEKSRRLYAVRVRNSRAPQDFIGPARRRTVSSDGAAGLSARAVEQQAGKRQAAKHCVSSCRGRTSMAKVPRARAHRGESAFLL